MKSKESHSTRHPSLAMRMAGAAAALVVVGAVATVAQGREAETAVGTNVSSTSTASPAAPAAPDPAASAAAPVAPGPAPAAPGPANRGPAAAPGPKAAPPAAPPAAGTGMPASAIDNAAVALPVKDAVAGFINKGGQIAADKRGAGSPGVEAPVPSTDDFTAVAHSSALGELEAKNQEFAVNGWQQSGTVQVVGKASTTTVDKGGSAIVSITVCLDSSAVSVIDNTGATVLAAEKAGTRKNLNTYAVQQVAGVWLVVEHTFPGDSSC